MAHEIDGNGNVLIHTFCVTRCMSDGSDPAVVKKRFYDYASGWNWARQIERDVEDNDPDYGTDDAYTVSIDCCSDWMEEDDPALDNEEFWWEIYE